MGRRKHATADGELLRNSVDGAELRTYIERVECVNESIAEAQGDRRELYAEIKREGYDAATVRAIVKRRAMDPEKRQAMDALMDEYRAALGVLADTPLGMAGADRLRELATHVSEA